MKILTIVAYTLVLSLMFISTQSCAEYPGSADKKQVESTGKSQKDPNVKDRTVSIAAPPGTVLLLAIDADNSVVFFDHKGNRLPNCKLCDLKLAKQFGPNCKNAEKEGIRICDGTRNTNVIGQRSIALWQTTNSFCTGGSGSGGDNNGVNCVEAVDFCADPNNELSAICRYCKTDTGKADDKCTHRH